MRSREEVPTLALIFATYVLFLTIPLALSVLPLALVVIALGIVIAQHSSLQHEILHGHPMQAQVLNDALAFPALGLFIPYLRFKDTHLAHHYDPNLTDPYDDPETNFLDVIKWETLPKWQRCLAQFNNTLFGRMLIGPVIALAAFYRQDLRAICAGDRRIILSYVAHLAGVALPVIWIAGFTAMPLWAYVMSAYIGASILKIRTFLEHRAHDRAAGRSVIIEDRGVLALLFLNNNYHAVHHAHPNVVWHRLPKLFEAKRLSFLQRNGGYTYASYREVFARYAFVQKDPVSHPLWTWQNRTVSKE